MNQTQMQQTKNSLLSHPLYRMPNTAPPPESRRRTFLAWPAWQRVLAVLPALALLWLGVLWATMESVPW